METFLRNHEHTLKALALLCLALFTLLEYSDYKSEQKIQRTLKFNEVAFKERVVEQRHLMEKALVSRKDKIEIFVDSTKKKKLSDEENKKAVLSYMAKVVKEDKLEGVVLGYFDFYTTLQNCIDSNVCDEDTARLMYGSNPRDVELIESYCFYILYFRKLWDNPKYASDAINLLSSEGCAW